MTGIKGYWYDAKHSEQTAVELVIDNHGYIEIFLDSATEKNSGKRVSLHRASFESTTVSSRLGNSARYLYFADGQKFESRDNDAIDQALKQHAPTHSRSLIYKLETYWRYVIAATVVMVLFGSWFTFYGVPTVAKAITYTLPESLFDKAGQQTLTLLDDDILQASELDDSVKQRVRDHFAPIMAQHPQHNIKLLFRASEEIGANAMALPDGTIIFTDEMIKLAANDDELLAVMAHEVGHVVHKHGMRGVVQGSLLSFAIVLMTGDASAVSEIFVTIPVLLTQLGYSRELEREADDYALNYMHQQGLDPQLFSSLMLRLQQTHSHCDETPVGNRQEQEGVVCEGSKGWQKYLSTHPSLQERLEKFNGQHSHTH